MAKKNKKSKPKSANCELTYFLDHPDIKRYESPGNGAVPMAKPSQPTQPSQPSKPSIASQINWPGTKK